MSPDKENELMRRLDHVSLHMVFGNEADRGQCTFRHATITYYGIIGILHLTRGGDLERT